jgi:serpin B
MVLIGVALITLAAIPADQEVTKIATDNNQFAFDLYQELIDDENGNIFFSPFSISTALAMTYAGADKNTAVEMANTMHFDENTPSYHLNYGKYLNQLEANAKGNIQLRIANRLWGEKMYVLKSEFINMNKKAYNSPLQKVDFIHSPDASRIQINNWVEEKTEDRIKDLIPKGVITTDTRLVLTNAIYFKGDWLYQFKKENTKQRKFHTSLKKSKVTEFMNFKGGLNYFENGSYKMLRLPYKGGKQSMVLVLPNKIEDLNKVEKEQNTKMFNQVFWSNKPEVIVSIPKFKLTQPLGLKKYLKNMGIQEAFTDGADFSKMSPSNDLYISDVVHKAFIEIDEKGTEAAAATAVVVAVESTMASKPRMPKEFIADHPFLFYIIDNETKAILFMGRMMNPREE